MHQGGGKSILVSLQQVSTDPLPLIFRLSSTSFPHPRICILFALLPCSLCLEPPQCFAFRRSKLTHSIRRLSLPNHFEPVPSSSPHFVSPSPSQPLTELHKTVCARSERPQSSDPFALRPQLQWFLSSGRAYEGGTPFQRKKIATDVTNLRLLHRMLADNVPIALIMEDDFVLPEGSRRSISFLGWSVFPACLGALVGSFFRSRP